MPIPRRLPAGTGSDMCRQRYILVPPPVGLIRWLSHGVWPQLRLSQISHGEVGPFTPPCADSLVFSCPLSQSIIHDDTLKPYDCSLTARYRHSACFFTSLSARRCLYPVLDHQLDNRQQALLVTTLSSDESILLNQTASTPSILWT